MSESKLGGPKCSGRRFFMALDGVSGVARHNIRGSGPNGRSWILLGGSRRQLHPNLSFLSGPALGQGVVDAVTQAKPVDHLSNSVNCVSGCEGVASCLICGVARPTMRWAYRQN